MCSILNTLPSNVDMLYSRKIYTLSQDQTEDRHLRLQQIFNFTILQIFNFTILLDFKLGI